MKDPIAPQMGPLRETVAGIDQQRRARVSMRLVARLAPWVAAALVLVAAGARWLGWPVALPLAVIGAAALVLVVMRVHGGRSLAVSEAAATRIDDDAALEGELASAHWFSGRASDDAWEAFHLDRASTNVAGVDWKALYPPVRATRRWMLTASLAVAAIVLSIVWSPARRVGVVAGDEADLAMLRGEVVPDDIRKALEALLGAVEKGEISPEGARMSIAELRAALANAEKGLDPKLALDAKTRAEAEKSKRDGSSMAERADKASDAAGLPEDVKWSLEDLATRLANSESQKRQTNEKNAAASSKTGEMGSASSQAEAEKMAAEAGMQFMRQAASDADQGQMMNGGGGAMGGDSGPGRGGRPGGPGRGDVKALQLALRQELITAEKDALGANVDTEVRRKTEQGRAKVGFTRVTAPTSFDRSRAATAPPVPEVHRPTMQRYFQRKK